MNKDKELKKIKNLTWLPFIGENYCTIPEDKRLMIIGESHYHEDTQESIEKLDCPNFTRKSIQELAIERDYWQTKVFPNFHRAMFTNDEFDTEVFWNLTSYVNIVQRPMVTSKGRPTYEDFYNGWLTLFETIKITKPNTCLFIGIEASNSLQNAISESDFKIVNSITKDDEIGGAYPRRATIKNSEQSIKLIFIRHTSQYFSWEEWNDYLKQKLSQQLKWFEKCLNSR